MSKLSLFLAKQKSKTAKPAKPIGVAESTAGSATTEAWLATSNSALKADATDVIGGAKVIDTAWGDAEDDTSPSQVQTANLQGGQLQSIQRAAAKEEAAVGQTPKEKTVKSWGKILITEGGVLLPSESASAAARTAADADNTTSAAPNYAAAASALSADSSTATAPASTPSEQHSADTDSKAAAAGAAPKKYVPPSQRTAGMTAAKRGPVKHVEPLKIEDATEFPDLGGTTTPTTSAPTAAPTAAPTTAAPTTAAPTTAAPTATAAAKDVPKQAEETAAVQETKPRVAEAPVCTEVVAEVSADVEAEPTATADASDDVADVAAAAEGRKQSLSQSVNAVEVLMAALKGLPVKQAIPIDAEGIMLKFKNRPRPIPATAAAR